MLGERRPHARRSCKEPSESVRTNAGVGWNCATKVSVINLHCVELRGSGNVAKKEMPDHRWKAAPPPSCITDPSVQTVRGGAEESVGVS